MGQPDPGPREERRAREASWTERYLGDGWKQVEPGIYRFEGEKTKTAEDSTAEDDLIEAIEPSRQAEHPPDEDSQPARRGRWLKR